MRFRRVTFLTYLMSMLTVGVLHGSGALAQSTPAANADVAISDLVNQHIHSIILEPQDVTVLIAQMGAGQSVSIQSSTGFDGGAASGVAHTHGVTLTRENLQKLSSGGAVSVTSETNMGHKHVFSFIPQNQCQAIPVVAAPSPSPSPVPCPNTDSDGDGDTCFDTDGDGR